MTCTTEKKANQIISSWSWIIAIIFVVVVLKYYSANEQVDCSHVFKKQFSTHHGKNIYEWYNVTYYYI